jgi:hypothetical protein
MADITHKPIPLAFIICDTVLVDKLTNKKSLIGIFNSINSYVFPFKHPLLNVFVSLTGGHAEYQCSIICTKDKDSQKIVQLSGPLNFKTPLDIVEANFEIRGIVFPDAGIYRFEFLCDEIPIITRKFQVAKIERKGHESNH